MYYLKKCFRIYVFNILQWINRHILKTYPPIEGCARCADCGRNVHDFHVPDTLWDDIVGQDVVLCYDCFCNRGDCLGNKHRMEVVWYCRDRI